MFYFLKFFSITIFIIECTPIIDTNNQHNLFSANFFPFIFIFLFFTNYHLNQSISYNLNFDLVFKYFLLFLKNPSTLLNYIINTFKKIILFLYHFKYRRIRKSILIFFYKYSNLFFVFWKPLFKKTSYFGYFRSNRSKWIK